MKRIINFHPGDIVLARLEQIMEEKGSLSYTETLRNCINEVHKSIFENYKRIQMTRLSMTGEDKGKESAKKQESKKDQQKHIEEEKQKAICNSLSGTITLDDVGLPVCTYQVYSMNGPHIVDESTVTDPLDILTPETVARQYTGLLGETGEKGRLYIEEARKRIVAQKK